jgi:hypothetical protein
MEPLGNSGNQRPEQIQGNNALLLGFALHDFDHIALDQAENHERVLLGGTIDDPFRFRRSADLPKNPQSPGALELEHCCSNCCGAGIPRPIRDHEYLH